MSLSTPHPIWTLAETPFEVSKAATVATMLSGRYVSDHRSRHWSVKNPEGNCQLCLVSGHPPTPGTLQHQLVSCPGLLETRTNSISHWSAYMSDKPLLLPLVKQFTLVTGPEAENIFTQFLLDPSACPSVISAVQQSGPGLLSHLLYMTRTWCHSNHLKRRRILKLQNII